MTTNFDFSRVAAVLMAVLTTVLSASQVSNAAEIVLRQQVTLRGPMVRLGDVADLSASNNTRLQELITTPLMPTPAPGTQKYLHVAQLRDLLNARGVSIADLRFRGAPQVVIRVRPKNLRNVSSKPTTSEPHTPTTSQTHSDQTSQRNVEKGQSDTQQPIEPTVQVVVMVRAVEKGTFVRADDIEIRNLERRMPFRAIQSLDQAVGKIAKQSLRSGVLLLENHLEAPRLVERGETVTVFARTAGIQVRTHAIAKQHGSLGALVQVETLDRGERFMARVTGLRELDVFTTGVTVAEHATLNRKRRQLR
jgi:flagella basal body P-ring formation protein FlgA